MSINPFNTANHEAPQAGDYVEAPKSAVPELVPMASTRAGVVEAFTASILQLAAQSLSPQTFNQIMNVAGAPPAEAPQFTEPLPAETPVSQSGVMGQVGAELHPAAAVEAASGFLDKGDALEAAAWDGYLPPEPADPNRMAETVTAPEFFANDWNMPDAESLAERERQIAAANAQVQSSFDQKGDAGMANPEVPQTVEYWNNVNSMPALDEVPMPGYEDMPNVHLDSARQQVTDAQGNQNQYGLAA